MIPNDMPINFRQYSLGNQVLRIKRSVQPLLLAPAQVSRSNVERGRQEPKRLAVLADRRGKTICFKLMNASPKVGTKLSFKSTLENWADGMDYCAIPVPANVTESLGTKSAVLVMACINESAPFKVSLFPVGGGKHYIRVRKKVRKESNLSEGDRVLVQITVLDRADIEVPKDLTAALRGKKALARFNALTPGKKNYMIRRIEDASKLETRAKRVREAVQEICRDKEKPAT